MGCVARLRTGEDCERGDRIPLGGMGNVHKSVDGSFYPLKITLPSNLTSHLLLSKTTRHPALQSVRIPMSNATAKAGTMCPLRTVGKPGMAMLHMWVNCALHPSGRLIINGLDATCLLATSPPSMTKMDVAPMSMIACNVAIVMLFKALCEVGLNNALVAIAHARGICVCTWTLFEETIQRDNRCVFAAFTCGKSKGCFVESREVKVFAETNLFNLCAIFFSPPPCQAKQY